ncbi:GTPase-associated system all-helical protein GASH [Bradyrhizobium sp. CB1717]|uniref:GTPase-associated system all-helical protein GASH n=1 Tax=Bradyrhizobium sp. CB1717 TaxID=3039154 RepID=UPI0024B1B803|nr:GTPase-associated system all-helical protein GASH [Bradyrhizobium sp. CB1717]WFU23633.1 GTPase-associated system all-helical protein GASH [Bradyrhizobium sp. CB1717]
MTKFDFIRAYRDLDAGAGRELVEARQKSFDKLAAAFEDMSQTYELCRLAFLCDPPAALDWFEQPMREFDPHFVLKKDSQEAGRMATLLLRKDMLEFGSYIPLAVLTSSYCGRRHSADDGVTTRQAAAAFQAAVRTHRVTGGRELPAPPELAAVKDLEALAQLNPVPGANVQGAVAAAMTSADEAIAALSQNVESSLSTTRSDVTRLAEEVDMLWWHIGDWHELLGAPRSAVAAPARTMVSGIELGAMVRQLPGPFGAHGILRRTAGKDGDAKTTLRAAVKALSREEAGKLAAEFPAGAQALFPVHAAIRMAAVGETWETELAKAFPDVAGVEVSQFEIGVQAFRERALIAQDGSTR